MPFSSRKAVINPYGTLYHARAHISSTFADFFRHCAQNMPAIPPDPYAWSTYSGRIKPILHRSDYFFILPSAQPIMPPDKSRLFTFLCNARKVRVIFFKKLLATPIECDTDRSDKSASDGICRKIFFPFASSDISYSKAPNRNSLIDNCRGNHQPQRNTSFPLFLRSSVFIRP